MIKILCLLGFGFWKICLLGLNFVLLRKSNHILMSLFVSFLQGKIVHQSLNIMNSFSQKVKIQQIRSLSEDVRFYYKRLRGNKEDLEPGKKSKVWKHCIWGFPSVSIVLLWPADLGFMVLLCLFVDCKHLLWSWTAVWGSLLCWLAFSIQM